MIKIKREILINSAHRSVHQHQLIPLIIVLETMIMLFVLKARVPSWCIRVILTPFIVRTVHVKTLILLRLVFFLLQVRMEVVGEEMPLSMNWWCKVTFKSFNNNSSPHSSPFNYRIKLSKAILWTSSLSNSVSNNNNLSCRLLKSIQPLIFNNRLSKSSSLFNKIIKLEDAIEIAGALLLQTPLSIFNSFNMGIRYRTLNLWTKSRKEGQDP